MKQEESRFHPSIEKLRWLQVKELKIKYPNDADLGAEVRKLVNKTP
jgi:hypothetical protein